VLLRNKSIKFGHQTVTEWIFKSFSSLSLVCYNKILPWEYISIFTTMLNRCIFLPWRLRGILITVSPTRTKKQLIFSTALLITILYHFILVRCFYWNKKIWKIIICILGSFLLRACGLNFIQGWRQEHWRGFFLTWRCVKTHLHQLGKEKQSMQRDI